MRIEGREGMTKGMMRCKVKVCTLIKQPMPKRVGVLCIHLKGLSRDVEDHTRTINNV